MQSVLLKLICLLVVHFKPSYGDAATDQLMTWKAKNPTAAIATDQRGVPVPTLTASQTAGAGRDGIMVMQDGNFLDFLAHFGRERIPERVVHAKGAGAFGEFVVTDDITKYTSAKIFEKVGKKTPVAARFSTVGAEKGSADTVNDPRGFAVKFYTDDGNWDLAGNNMITFPIRDPILFPSFVHSRKRNPQTNLFDPNMFWDFVTLRQESVLHTLLQFALIPESLRKMDGFGVHTFKMVNARMEAVYVKFHWLSEQGVKGLDWAEATRLAGVDPDYCVRDLYNAIEAKEFPSWKLAIQVMTFEQAAKYKWHPFDATKFWRIPDVPLIHVGKMTLNRNAENNFEEIEQLAFHPGNLVPGIEPSPDRMLIGRMFSYSDSQNYRLGANFLELPVNRPDPMVKITSYMRDGRGKHTKTGAAPNYFPNSFMGAEPNIRGNQTTFPVEAGDVVRLDTGDDDNYSLAQWHYTEVMTPNEKQTVAKNIAGHLSGAMQAIQKRALEMYAKVSPDLEKMISKAMSNKGNYKNDTKNIAEPRENDPKWRVGFFFVK